MSAPGALLAGDSQAYTIQSGVEHKGRLIAGGLSPTRRDLRRDARTLLRLGSGCRGRRRERATGINLGTIAGYNVLSERSIKSLHRGIVVVSFVANTDVDWKVAH